MSLLSVTAAQERILNHFKTVESVTLSLDQCAGRVLASDIISSDLPLFDNSSVDGFALIAADLTTPPISAGRTLRVVGDIPAGSASDIVISQGQAARIMTGAPMPKGADAVIMVEDTDFNTREPGKAAPENVIVYKTIKPGENIRFRGMDIKSGRKVLFTGQRLRAQDVGLLAMLGVAQVNIYRKPLIALLSSGDELIRVDSPLEPGKIRDTNSFTLTALITEAGCEVISLGVAPDRSDAIQFLFEQAVGVNADLILSSAGVSVGAFDFIKNVIEANGSLDFWRVNMRPGKPLAVGDYKGLPFIGLPGNPVSAFVGFEVFVRAALAKLAGQINTGISRTPGRPKVQVRLAENIESDGRESYLRAIIDEQEGVFSAKLTGHQGSGNLLSLVQANALLIIPAGVKSLAIGAKVDAWLL
jgi:molybdopterin molybdotransferase